MKRKDINVVFIHLLVLEKNAVRMIGSSKLTVGVEND